MPGILPLSAILTELTLEQEQQATLVVAQNLGLETTAWAEGSPSRGVLDVWSQKSREVKQGVALAIRGGFLDYASGAWLTLLAEQVYEVTRIPETSASGVLTLTNASAGAYVLAAGDIVASNAATDVTYRSTTGGVLAGGGGTLDVDIICEQAGSVGTSGAGTITTMVSTLSGVTCTNAAALVGQDEQSDASLRQSCYDARALAAIEPGGTGTHLGPLAAYRYVATHTPRPTGELCDVTRIGAVLTPSTGAIAIRLAGSNGAPIGGDVTLIEDAMELSCVPACIALTVAGASNVNVPVTATAYVLTTWAETNAEIQAAALAAMVALFADYPIGGLNTAGGAGWLYADLVKATLESASAGIFSLTLTTPAANVALTTAQVARLVMAATDLTIVRVTP